MRFLKAYLPVFLWMLVIFLASTDLGSSGNTSRFIGPFVRWFYPEATDETIKLVQALVRKSGHVVEYAILSMIMWRSRRSLQGTYREWHWSEAMVIIPVCVAYAITDELHQHFVSTRQASPIDVGFDSAGAILGLLLIWAFGRLRKFW